MKSLVLTTLIFLGVAARAESVYQTYTCHSSEGPEFTLLVNKDQTATLQLAGHKPLTLDGHVEYGTGHTRVITTTLNGSFSYGHALVYDISLLSYGYDPTTANGAITVKTGTVAQQPTYVQCDVSSNESDLEAQLEFPVCHKRLCP